MPAKIRTSTPSPIDDHLDFPGEKMPTIGSDSVCAWYDTMFSKAKDSIYIEDQFLFQDKAITQIRVNWLKNERNLKIITVGPMEPNLPGFVLELYQKKALTISIVI